MGPSTSLLPAVFLKERHCKCIVNAKEIDQGIKFHVKKIIHMRCCSKPKTKEKHF